VPKSGRLYIKPSPKITIARGAPVFLTDRRETHLDNLISLLEDQLEPTRKSCGRISPFILTLPAGISNKSRLAQIPVFRRLAGRHPPGPFGLWLSREMIKKTPAKTALRVSWWLPPVIWPENENAVIELVRLAIRKGGRHFVLNAPWQIAFFKRQKGCRLWAGPFCNLANPLAIGLVSAMGFCGAVVSPELGSEDYLQLPRHSPIPLAIVTKAIWPLCVARTLAEDIQQNKAFSSPRGEQAWATRHGSDYWIYPNWKLDLSVHKNTLRRAGYAVFIDLIEPIPDGVQMKKRNGLWNWEIKLG
jgi:putative protease